MPAMSDKQFEELIERVRETRDALTAQQSTTAPQPTIQEAWAARFTASTQRVRPPFDARALLADMAERGTATGAPWSTQAA